MQNTEISPSVFNFRSKKVQFWIRKSKKYKRNGQPRYFCFNYNELAFVVFFFLPKPILIVNYETTTLIWTAVDFLKLGQVCELYCVQKILIQLLFANRFSFKNINEPTKTGPLPSRFVRLSPTKKSTILTQSSHYLYCLGYIVLVCCYWNKQYITFVVLITEKQQYSL